jgi:hypothetical protein
MTDFFNKAIAWIKANVLLSVLIGFAALTFFFPKVLRGIFGTTRRRRRRIASMPARRTMHRTTKRHYNKSGKAKKPWQIKGSEAARRHMAKLRRMR